MPWLKVECKGTWSFVTTLVDVSGRVVENTHHRNDTVGGTVGTCDVGACGSDVVDVQANTTCGLGDQSTLFQGVVDTLDRVILHCDQETGGHLVSRGTCVEQGWRSVGEVSLGHQVVRLDGAVDVVAVDADSDSHDQVLRSFGDLAVQSQEVGSLKGLETKVVVVEVTVVVDRVIQDVCVFLDDLVRLRRDHRRVLVVLRVDVPVQLLDNLGELLCRLFLEVRDRHSGRQRRVVWVDCRHVGGGFRSQVVQLDCRDPVVDTRDDSLRDGGGMHVFRVQPVRQLL